MKKYTYPLSSKLRSLYGILFSCALIYYFRIFYNSLLVIIIILALVLLILGFIDLYESFTTYTTTSTGIIVKKLFRSEMDFNSKDIATIVDLNDNNKVILKNNNGERLFSINKNLNSFEEFKEVIKNKHSNHSRMKIEDNFRIDKYILFGLITGVIFFAGPLIFAFIMKELWIAVLSVAATTYLLYLVRKIIISICLSFSSITLRYIYKTRVISMVEVRNIHQETKHNSNNIKITSTVIELINGEIIALSKYKPDDELLFQSCKYYFDNKKRAT